MRRMRRKMRPVRVDGRRGQAGTAEVGVPACPVLGCIVSGRKSQSLFQQLKS